MSELTPAQVQRSHRAAASIWVPHRDGPGSLRAAASRRQHQQVGADHRPGLLRTWRDVYHVGRVLRVLCEHARFDFQGDGPDAEMVRREAQQLARDMYTLDRPLRYLLGEVGERDPVDLEALYDSDLDHDVADEPPPESSPDSDLHEEVTRPLLLPPADDSLQERSEDDLEASSGDLLDDALQESSEDDPER